MFLVDGIIIVGEERVIIRELIFEIADFPEGRVKSEAIRDL